MVREGDAQRLFRDVEHVNRNLLVRWRQRVRPGDRLFCLGDVVQFDLWFDLGFAVDLAACPGERPLIIGNHDVDQFEELGPAGFGRQYAAAVFAISPLLVLTHVPLHEVPWDRRQPAWQPGAEPPPSQPVRRTHRLCAHPSRRGPRRGLRSLQIDQSVVGVARPRALATLPAVVRYAAPNP